MIRPVLVVHAGAGKVEGPDQAEFRAGIEAALAAGIAALHSSAVDAVEVAVRVMELHPVMNAGIGACLDETGAVALDAGFMDGRKGRFGAVCGVTCTPHPSALARHLAVQNRFGRLLGAPASDALARELGRDLCEPAALVTARARARHAARKQGGAADTVGAVALDAAGNLAAAVSTGGVPAKPSGRIGDSPVVGAGFYARNGSGACVATGTGELLLRESVARRTVDRIVGGEDARVAARTVLAETGDPLSDGHDGCGLIVVTAGGEVLAVHNSPAMPAGWIRIGGKPEIADDWR